MDFDREELYLRNGVTFFNQVETVETALGYVEGGFFGDAREMFIFTDTGPFIFWWPVVGEVSGGGETESIQRGRLNELTVIKLLRLRIEAIALLKAKAFIFF